MYICTPFIIYMSDYSLTAKIQEKVSMNKVVVCALTVFGMWDVAAIAAESMLNDTVSLKDVVVSAPYKTTVELTPLTVTTVTASTIEKSGESSLLPSADLPAMECRAAQQVRSVSVE